MMSLWNSREMIRLRTNLVAGTVENTTCDRCYDRLFSADHDIFGMVRRLPRYSKRDEPAFDAYWRKADDAYAQGLTNLDQPPLEPYVFTSEQCNLKCIMCRQNTNYREFPTDGIKSVVQELGWDRIDRFGWVGGEPFLTPDALDLLEFVASQDTRGACIYITTNGVLMDRHLNQLDRIDNLLLTLSMDAVGEAYEKVRVPAKWDRMERNLALLREHRKWHPNWRININTVVMKSTYPFLTDMLRLAETLEATIFFAPINGGHCAEDIFFNPFLLDTPSRFDEDVDRAIERARETGASKAQDSLEKLRLYMGFRRQCFRTPVSRFIMRRFSEHMPPGRRSLVSRGLRGILKLLGSRLNAHIHGRAFRIADVQSTASRTP